MQKGYKAIEGLIRSLAMVEASDLRRLVFVAFPLLLAQQVASAATAVGDHAMALAALVAENSPLLGPNEKMVMARLIDGNLNFAFPKNKKISVRADAVVCRASDLDITSCSCDLTFGKKIVAVRGRKAHELFATIGLVAVPPDGPAGAIVEGLSHLMCTINPGEVQQMSGGGADCKFDPDGP
jgi:hypothetical protein